MKLKFIITLTLIGFSLLKPCDCHQLIHFQSSSFDDQVLLAAYDQKQLSIPCSLPRKLRSLLTEKSTVTIQNTNQIKGFFGDKDSATSYSVPKKTFPGKLNYKTTERVETDSSGFLTMDYHWVRRRRPIHNQAMPTP